MCHWTVVFICCNCFQHLTLVLYSGVGVDGIIVTMIPLKGSCSHSCGDFFLYFFSAVSHMNYTTEQTTVYTLKLVKLV